MPHLSPYLLSHNEIYKVLQTQLQNLSRLKSVDAFDLEQDLYKNVYVSWHQRNHTQPDRIFFGHWKQIKHRYDSLNSWALAVFTPVANHYFDEGDKVFIKTPYFDEWQTYISNNTALPVLANKIANFSYEPSIKDTFDLLHLLQDRLGYRPYLTPDEPLLDNFICNYKLYETHIHLNGTSSFERSWHDALLRPRAFIDELKDSWKNRSKVKLLYATHPALKNPNAYYQLIVLARYLREYLLVWQSSNGSYGEIKELRRIIADVIAGDEHKQTYYFSYEQSQFGSSSDSHMIMGELLHTSAHDSYIKELHWHIRVQQKLRAAPDNYSDIAYLLYMVCMNTTQKLFVQRDDQYGFDNFQKIADNRARELVEQSYKDRFFQLHGPYCNKTSDMKVIEGRFSPKETSGKNIEIIKKILLGFLEYRACIGYGKEKMDSAQDLESLIKKVIQQDTKLYLIAHFIKKPESSQESHSFASLRRDLWRRAYVLVGLIKNYPSLNKILKAVDAASNELDTPPEVLAPVFRYCRSQGIQHFTYHVGEDFEHLIGGIRAIYEAIEFLPLQSGDRVGHATAIGIPPKLWLKNLPVKPLLSTGEWLDNLLFVRHMILTYLLEGFNLPEVENYIYQLHYNIYSGVTMQGSDVAGFSDFNMNLIYLAYSYRYLEPVKVLAFLDKDYVSLQECEYQQLKELNGSALQLAKVTWFDDQVRARRKKPFEIDIDFNAEQMLKLQQCVQKIIADKKIVIESLLTSNVRISHYKSLHEHHIFRWLHVKNRVFDGDKKMRVVLGSDDPGIFATDLRGEYYHLFCSLKSHFGYSEEKSLELIKVMHTNSQTYHFC